MGLKEKAEFLQLRDQFHQNQKVSLKDRRLASFSSELQAVLNFTEKSDDYRENKCILIGIAFAGPFICVNTRQLKTFLGRCKSSINGSLQQLGYVALRTKSKARNCVLSVLPALTNEANLLRQWSVRCASEDAKFCFISRFMPTNIPSITNEDLFDDKKQSNSMANQSNLQKGIPFNSLNKIASAAALQRITAFATAKSPYGQNKSTTPLKPRKFDFELPSYSEIGMLDTMGKVPEMTPSFSVGNIAEIAADLDYLFDAPSPDWNSNWNRIGRVPRSKSAFLQDDADVFLF